MQEGYRETLSIDSIGCPQGCRLCVDACRNRNGLSLLKSVQAPDNNYNSIMLCYQCSDPRCMKVCPTGAITRDEGGGITKINQEICIGCGLCALSCEHGGIVYDYSVGKSFKCDLCGDQEPYCAAACQPGILSYLRSRPIIEHFEGEDRLVKGVSLCAGCPVELAERIMLRTLGEKLILFLAPGCAIGSMAGIEGMAQCKVSVYSCLMTNIASSATGVKRYYQKIGRDVTCVCFVGDGATADIGLQVLSGAVERGEKMVYICYDNEAYMNTGIQRSSTTPYKSWTTTTAIGKKSRGKSKGPKNLPLMMLMNGASYVATASIGYLEDFILKLKKAQSISKQGFAYIHLFSPCPPGWRAPTHLGIKLSRLAVETNYFPLWEAEDGIMKMTCEIENAKPLEVYTSKMGRFSHLKKPELQDMQKSVNKNYHLLNKLMRSFSR